MGEDSEFPIIGIDGAISFLRQTVPVGAQTIRKAVKAGRIPHLRLGNRLFFREADLRGWVDAGRVEEAG